MSELKAGDSIDFKVGDKTLTIEPVPYGNIKKIMRIAFDASKEIVSGQLSGIPELVDRNLSKIMPLMFTKDRYPFLTIDWIEETMTVPTLRKMMEAAIVVNGLQDFFERGSAKTKAAAAAPTPETLQENHGSIISSGSPTDGDPKTSTN